MRAGAAMQTAAGSVSAFFTLEGYDRRRGVATYALRVINRTKSALICRTWVLSANGEPLLAYPALFEVEPYSTSATEVPVWPKDFPSFERAIAEVVGNGVHCVVEAAAPVLPKPRRTQLIVAAASLVVGLLIIASSALLRGAMPRIAALAVAPQALAGTTVEAQYSVFGSGRLSYFVTAPDGKRVAGGELAAHTGSVFIPIPAGTQPGAYTLRMTMDGPLGTASDARVVNALISGPAGAQINDISVNPTVARPGQAIEVSYSASATDGYVRLVGTDGTIWAQKPFSSSGQAHLIVPPVGDGKELHVLLHVTKGSSTAQSVAGVLVSSPVKASLATSNVSSLAGDNDPNLPSITNDGSDANGTFAVVEREVHSGSPIDVKILSPRNGMRISLMDGQSREVTGTDAGVDGGVVTLRAPAVTAATRYTVVATFTDGFGQESVVQPITVLP